MRAPLDAAVARRKEPGVYFKQILDERCGCASYLVASRQTGEAAIIDPAIVIDQYDALLQERSFRLQYVIDTHVHADHVSGARALAAEHGAEVCLHESAKVSYPFRPLRSGEELALGQLRLRIIHTPGHRPELISILVVNPERSPEPSMVLTGDSLLVGDVGRPDFGGGDARDQYESLSQLLRLPDWVAVFPGHFEGPCGKGMCGRPSTTIGFERLFNPLARMPRDRFVTILSDGIPARPLNMTTIEATNRGAVDGAWAMLTTLPPVPDIPAAELDPTAPGTMLIDVREPAEYVRGHIPQAVNIPQADLAARIEELPTDQEVRVVCQGGFRSLRAAQFLKQAGFERIVNVTGGTGAWIEAGKPVIAEEEPSPAVQVIDSEWTHAGATVGTYSI
jgi:glyoxylase-like metal-dependent hydrolase (beta-lactamase superfamily II)/rhodanese-related sulfurtransferase